MGILFVFNARKSTFPNYFCKKYRKSTRADITFPSFFRLNLSVAFTNTINTRYRHTFGTPKTCARNVVASVTRESRCRRICPEADVPATRESIFFALRGRELRLPCR